MDNHEKCKRESDCIIISGSLLHHKMPSRVVGGVIGSYNREVVYNHNQSV